MGREKTRCLGHLFYSIHFDPIYKNRKVIFTVTRGHARVPHPTCPDDPVPNHAKIRGGREGGSAYYTFTCIPRDAQVASKAAPGPPARLLCRRFYPVACSRQSETHQPLSFFSCLLLLRFPVFSPHRGKKKRVEINEQWGRLGTRLDLTGPACPTYATLASQSNPASPKRIMTATQTSSKQSVSKFQRTVLSTEWGAEPLPTQTHVYGNSCMLARGAVSRVDRGHNPYFPTIVIMRNLSGTVGVDYLGCWITRLIDRSYREMRDFKMWGPYLSLS
jgi:hypothetical protein